MKDTPERIWLQIGEDLDLVESFYDVWEEVTWADNNVHGNDIEYVRADLFSQLIEAARNYEIEGMCVDYPLYRPDNCPRCGAFQRLLVQIGIPDVGERGMSKWTGYVNGLEAENERLKNQTEEFTQMLEYIRDKSIDLIAMQSAEAVLAKESE